MSEHSQTDGPVIVVDADPVTRVGVKRQGRSWMLIAGIACLTAAGLLWLRPTSDALLCRNLLPLEAEQICEALAAIDVNGILRDNGSTILVPRHRLHEARLQAARRIAETGASVRFELIDFTKSNLPKGKGYLAALQGELEMTLRSIGGVESVRVLIETPGNRGRINGDRPLAVVLLHTAPSTRLTAEQHQVIQQLVASSTDLLTPDEVTVSENPSSLASFKHQTL
jgi:flagellar M-ring protein FliF